MQITLDMILPVSHLEQTEISEVSPDENETN